MENPPSSDGKRPGFRWVFSIAIVNTLARQKLCLLSLRTANPFPLESFCQHDSGQFPRGKSFFGLLDLTPGEY